jgi:hypothetical protein
MADANDIIALRRTQSPRRVEIRRVIAFHRPDVKRRLQLGRG